VGLGNGCVLKLAWRWEDSVRLRSQSKLELLKFNNWIDLIKLIAMNVKEVKLLDLVLL